MKNRKRSTLVGAALILFGVLGGVALARWQENNLDRLLLKLPWGGLSRPAAPAGAEGPEKLTFSAGDVSLAPMQYGSDCAYRPDRAALLQQELSWDLTGEKPTVLILHTHASECYTRQPGQNYAESADYRTQNTAYNMVAVGDKLASLLAQAGISVLHDRQIHDYPTYSSAYTNSRESVQRYLRQYPSICLVLDLHRDAMLNSDGSQYAATVVADGVSTARMMLVVGTDAAGMQHPAWQENLALALKMQVLLEKSAPGITRPTMLRAQRFNQDLLPGMLIVEMGAAGNTLQQALAAAEYLARAVIALSGGTTADSTS